MTTKPDPVDRPVVLEALDHWSITMEDGTEWCDLTEAQKAIRALPSLPATDEAPSIDITGEAVAIEHGFTRQQYREAKSIENGIFGPYQWQNQGDRAASMMVRICQALKDQQDAATDEVAELRADSRQIRMAVAAWLEGRRDAEFWMKHIHVTLGSPTADKLKQPARAALKDKQP
jgi:hypothetical protein